MKKFTFILAAAACLFLTSCTVEYSCTYLLGHYVESFSCSGNPESTAALIYQEFTDEIIAYDKAHEGEWEWTVYVKGDNYEEADNVALAKYEKVVAEIEAINSKYLEKFKKCSATDYEVEEIHYVELKRISNINATLGHKDFTMSFGK